MIRKTKINGRELTLDLRDEADESVFREIFLDRDYRVVEEIIVKAKTPILDIGGHIGLFSLYAATLNPHVNIFTFEPEEKNYQHLKHHLKTNNVRNVQTKMLAVSDKDGEGEIFISEDSHNHSLVSGGEKKQKISITTLDRLMEKNRLENISLAKMDCEGAEYDIILGTPDDTLSKIKSFYIEYHIYNAEMNPQKISQKLKNLGYNVKQSQSSYSKNLGFIFAFKSAS